MRKTFEKCPKCGHPITDHSKTRCENRDGGRPACGCTGHFQGPKVSESEMVAFALVSNLKSAMGFVAQAQEQLKPKCDLWKELNQIWEDLDSKVEYIREGGYQ